MSTSWTIMPVMNSTWLVTFSCACFRSVGMWLPYRQHHIAGDAQALVLVTGEEMLDLDVTDLAERALIEDDVAHDALDGRVVDDELAVIAEDRPLMDFSPRRRRLVDERLKNDCSGSMR